MARHKTNQNESLYVEYQILFSKNRGPAMIIEVIVAFFLLGIFWPASLILLFVCYFSYRGHSNGCAQCGRFSTREVISSKELRSKLKSDIEYHTATEGFFGKTTRMPVSVINTYTDYHVNYKCNSCGSTWSQVETFKN